MRKLILTSLLLSFFVAGCAGRMEYRPPNCVTPQSNSVEVNKSKEEVWKIIVPALGKNFFVINNLDKESGLINISYSGNPEKYVDCGYIESYVKNARGERTYCFPASSAQQTYEVMDMNQAGGLFVIDRKMNLEGRMNLIIEEIAPNKTLVTANMKYILTKSATVRNVQNVSRSFSDTISFNSNQSASFPGNGPRISTLCQANGMFEQEILSLILNEK